MFDELTGGGNRVDVNPVKARISIGNPAIDTVVPIEQSAHAFVLGDDDRASDIDACSRSVPAGHVCKGSCSPLLTPRGDLRWLSVEMSDLRPSAGPNALRQQPVEHIKWDLIAPLRMAVIPQASKRLLEDGIDVCAAGHDEVSCDA